MFKRIRRQMKKYDIQKSLEKDYAAYKRKVDLLETIVFFHDSLKASGALSDTMKKSLEFSVEEMLCDICKVEADIHAARFELEMF